MTRRLGPWGPLGILLLVVAAALVIERGEPIAADMRLYLERGGQAMAGLLPYRDVAFEYPPLAIVPMALPYVVWPFGVMGTVAFSVIFAAVAGLLAVAIGWLLRGQEGGGAAAAGRWTVLVLLAAASIAFRFDIWPAALVLVALVAADRGRPGWAGAALGAGTMLKLFPVVVLPVLVVQALALGDRRGMVRLVAGFGAVVGVIFGATLLAAGPAALQWLTYFRDRGLQLESTGSGLLLLAHLLAGHPAEAAWGFGAIEVRSPGADVFVAAAPLLELAMAGLAWGLAAVRFRVAARSRGIVPLPVVALASVLAILALIVPSKVFSVQYLVWILPLLPLLPPPAFRLGAMATGLTTLIYPLFYSALVEFSPALTLILNLRNALLVTLAAWLALQLVSATRSEATVAARGRARPLAGGALDERGERGERGARGEQRARRVSGTASGTR